MPKSVTFAACLAGLLLPCYAARAQEEIEQRQITFEALVNVAQQIKAMESYKDNAFSYEERAGQLRQSAQSLAGTTISFQAAVKLVTRQEVILFYPDDRRARIALQHGTPPTFGNLQTVFYSGGRSTEWAQILSQPMTLRIGSEIDDAVARTLRRGDVLLLRGRLDSFQVLLEDVFEPRAIAIVSGFEVIEVQR